MLNKVRSFFKGIGHKIGLRVNVKAAIPSKKVWVGLSGGVDSAVSAYLLKKQGYDVTGVFIKVWQPEDAECTWKEDRRDAMRVCAEIGIPFMTLDLIHEYKMQVVDYMISEYSKGRTPNPDIMCNRHIKFGGFLDLAIKNGIDYVATGHYARSAEVVDSDHRKRFTLHEGADKSKDQSYFLWTLNSTDLSRVLFPIGHLQKSKVRKIAKKNNLPVFDKKDSQGICFIGHVDMKEFLKKHIKTGPGKVLDTEGKVIGEHDGAVLYTIGERIGFRPLQTGTDDKPMYILSKDIGQNSVTVTSENLLTSEQAVRAGQGLSPDGGKSALIINVNWNEGDTPALGQIEARVRYRQEKQLCQFDRQSSRVKFKKPQVMAPGQSVVFYTGERCLGGGIIV